MAECKRLLSLKHETALVEQTISTAHVSILHGPKKQPSMTASKLQKRPTTKPSYACWSCGEWHYVRFCPFKNHIRQKCNKRGYKEDYCRSTTHTQMSHKKSGHRKSRKSYSKARSVVSTYRTDNQSKRKFITVFINGKPAKLQLDTASDITLISRSMWNHIGRPKIVPSNKRAKNASGGEFKLTGEITCNIALRDISTKETCYLTDRPNLNLLGLDWI